VDVKKHQRINAVKAEWSTLILICDIIRSSKNSNLTNYIQQTECKAIKNYMKTKLNKTVNLSNRAGMQRYHELSIQCTIHTVLMVTVLCFSSSEKRLTQIVLCNSMDRFEVPDSID
jgi:hypothetical protein